MTKKVKIITVVLAVCMFLGCGLIVLGLVAGKDRETKAEMDVEAMIDKIHSLNLTDDFYNTDISGISGNVYYVDAQAEPGNDGLSMENPLCSLEEVNQLKLKPGDAVLFQNDGEWHGSLQISYSGTAEKPILVGNYGDGINRPAIHGDGIVSAAVCGSDVSYITVENLEVTNESDQTKRLRGIYFNAVRQNVSGLVVQNCYVHDVDSQPDVFEEERKYSDPHFCGGIMMMAGTADSPEMDVKFDDILIRNNKVDSCSLCGITVGSGDLITLSTNIRVVGNYVSNCFGDAILLYGVDGGLVEGNIGDTNGTRNNLSYAYAGIWCFGSKNVTFQYNESFGFGTSQDGQGFDIDAYCDNITIQYNYSHDNYGGFLLIMDLGIDGRHTVRYNVSRNDGTSFITTTLALSNGGVRHQQVDIYQNTFYTTKPIDCLFRFFGFGADRVYMNARNNIFCVDSEIKPPVFSNSALSNRVVFGNNCWYGFEESLLPAGEAGRIVEDPMFSNPRNAYSGMEGMDGFQLLEDSPCLNAGTEIFGNATTDYWGNETSENHNIGAYMGKAVEPPTDANLASGKTVTMSSVDGIAMAEKSLRALLTDGVFDKAVSTMPAEAAGNPEWIEIDLGKESEISRVVLYAGQNNPLFPKEFTISIGDGESWNEVVSQSEDLFGPKQDVYTFTFQPVKGSRLRIDITQMRETGTGTYAAALSEVEAYKE